MRFPLGQFLCVAWYLAAAWSGDAIADPPPATLSPEAVADFEWFSTLGFPDVRGCPAVRVTFQDAIITSSAPPKDFVLDGFLLRHGDDGRNTVLTPDLIVHSYDGLSPGSAEPIRYEEKLLTTQADEKLDFLQRTDSAGSELLRRRFEERLSERGQVFVWAWTCWRNGLETHAARLYARAAAMPQSNRHELEKTSVRERLENDLGAAMLGRATFDFEDPKIPRTQLLEMFARVARNYPASKYAARADETADRLRAMVAEDAVHAARSPTPLESLPLEQRVAELIFRLRDQNGHQYSQPGSCNILIDDSFGRLADGVKEKSPAGQLVDLGYIAVPQLIAALEEKRFSRSVGFGRDLILSPHVLTVGDCARQILQAIAGHDFLWAQLNASYQSKDDEISAIKKRAQEWWQNIQQKGEKQALIEAVIPGGNNAAQEADVLCKRYPDAALAPMIEGASNTHEGWAHDRLVELIGKISR